jgi:hypothetical protein
LHRLEPFPVTIGRALSNSIILDDPYVDAHHASIIATERGDFVIEDAGSVNGVLANGQRVNGPVALLPGSEIRLGRTVLRVRDENEAVPPAIREGPRPSFVSRQLQTSAGALVVVATMLLAVALNTWLGNSERSGGTTVFAAALGAAFGACAWAAIWAVVARGVDRRFHLLSHLRVISLAVLGMLVYGILHEWLAFLFPDAAILSVGYGAVLLAITAAVIAGHLAVVGALTARRRWRVGFTVSGVILAVIVAGALVGEEQYSDVPSFPGQLKQMPAEFVPTQNVNEFLVAMREAKEEVDSALLK